MYAELKSTYAEVISIGETEGRIYFCNLGPRIWIAENVELYGRAWYTDNIVVNDKLVFE